MELYRIVDNQYQEDKTDTGKSRRQWDRQSQELNFQVAHNKSSSSTLSRAQPTEGRFGKIAIPQLRSSSVEKKYRISHACASCQESKMKCDGARPYCRRCMTYGAQCFYRPRKHQKMKEWEILVHFVVFNFLTIVYRDLSKLSAELNDYRETLQVLCSHVDDKNLELIENVLAKYSSAWYFRIQVVLGCLSKVLGGSPFFLRIYDSSFYLL